MFFKQECNINHAAQHCLAIREGYGSLPVGVLLSYPAFEHPSMCRFESGCPSQSGFEHPAMCRFEIKHVSGLGHQSPPRGGGQGGAANQQILISSSEDGSEGACWLLSDLHVAHDKLAQQCGWCATAYLTKQTGTLQRMLAIELEIVAGIEFHSCQQTF